MSCASCSAATSPGNASQIWSRLTTAWALYPWMKPLRVFMIRLPRTVRLALAASSTFPSTGFGLRPRFFLPASRSLARFFAWTSSSVTAQSAPSCAPLSSSARQVAELIYRKARREGLDQAWSGRSVRPLTFEGDVQGFFHQGGSDRRRGQAAGSWDKIESNEKRVTGFRP